MAINNQRHEDGNSAKTAMSQGRLLTLAINNGYRQRRKDRKKVLVRWSTAQGWQQRKDGDGAMMTTVCKRLSTTAINNGQSTMAINDSH
jgi:hypothetical protein